MTDVDPTRTAGQDAPYEDIRFRILHALDSDPSLSQRGLARTTGVSLGAANAHLNALIERGLVEIGNAETAPARFRIAYVLTAKGKSERTRLTTDYIARRQAEADRLLQEIETLAPMLTA